MAALTRDLLLRLALEDHAEPGVLAALGEGADLGDAELGPGDVAHPLRDHRVLLHLGELPVIGVAQTLRASVHVLLEHPVLRLLTALFLGTWKREN